MASCKVSWHCCRQSRRRKPRAPRLHPHLRRRGRHQSSPEPRGVRGHGEAGELLILWCFNWVRELTFKSAIVAIDIER
jgi:hypothetical protein